MLKALMRPAADRTRAKVTVFMGFWLRGFEAREIGGKARDW